MHDPTTLAYTAGILDGEGSVQIISTPPSGRYKTRRYYVNVTIGMCHEETIRWLVETFGFRLHVKVPKNPCHRTAYLAILQHLRAADFLRLVQPYVRTKAKQVELALKFTDGYGDWFKDRPQRKNAPRVPEEVQSRRAAAFEEMRLLNLRGRQHMAP